MKTTKHKLPVFKTEEEIDKFWSTHDFTDYADEFEPVSGPVKLDPKLAKKIRDRVKKKHLVAIRLDDDQYSIVQKLALRKSLGLSSLIRMWISQALQRELRST